MTEWVTDCPLCWGTHHDDPEECPQDAIVKRDALIAVAKAADELMWLESTSPTSAAYHDAHETLRILLMDLPKVLGPEFPL